MSRALTPSQADLDRLAKSPCEKSLSKAARTTYACVVREYLPGIDADPLVATPDDVRRWRDRLIRNG